MGGAGPHRVEFSRHSVQRARRTGRSLAAIADVVVDEHHRRRLNGGSGDWSLSAAGLTVIYNWPSGGDVGLARVVTLWVDR